MEDRQLGAHTPHVSIHEADELLHRYPLSIAFQRVEPAAETDSLDDLLLTATGLENHLYEIHTELDGLPVLGCDLLLEKVNP